jgi:Flp pilus assembly protein TadD/2-polyprenyl-3-methyl-5-hydroxy-6-metoxy-1,4-benzoquinol methylase
MLAIAAGVAPRDASMENELAAKLAQLFDSALALHRTGDLEGADRAYRRILELHPEQPDALNLLAVIMVENGQHGAATELLRRAIAVSGEVPQFHCHLGNALQGLGDFAGAAAAYRQAISLLPDYVEAHSSLGFALAQLGELPEAVECFNAALARDADYFFALNNLGDTLSAQGNLDGAAQAYRRAIAVEPHIGELHTKLGAVLREQGHLPEAVEQLWVAIDTGDHDLTAYRALGSLLRISLPSVYDRSLEQRVLGFFNTVGVDHVDVVEFATALVRLKYADDARFAEQSNFEFAVDTLLADALVCALLTKSVNGDAHLEILLTGARRRLLLQRGGVGDAALSAMSVLAQQCFNNEYVFAVGKDEQARLGQLRTVLESYPDWIPRPGPEIQCSLLLFSMYEPLAQLSVAPRLAQVPAASWNDVLRPMVERSLLEPMEERALEAEIPVVGLVENSVSRVVKAQYQENPYPRWLTPAYRNPGNLHGILRNMFPAFEPPEMLKNAIRVLVVGCGTGHHPISIALRYADATVVATDISRRSLAYGMRSARQLGITNVRFVENDLLNLSELDGQFHVIECVGVLHHMQSIADGMKALVGKLHENGLLKIGLYSHTARRPVVYARERIARLGSTAVADDIRRFRQTVLAAPEDDALRRILDFGDFYTLSNCRDLLFHAHEQHVTIAAIRSLLTVAELRFIGFETMDATLADEYRRRFPGDGAMDDLCHWETVEELNPGAFAGLYQCWCAS